MCVCVVQYACLFDENISSDWIALSHRLLTASTLKLLWLLSYKISVIVPWKTWCNSPIWGSVKGDLWVILTSGMFSSKIAPMLAVRISRKLLYLHAWIQETCETKLCLEKVQKNEKNKKIVVNYLIGLVNSTQVSITGDNILFMLL